ncbi:MAG: TetR family transcriptional regulator C-terminal domain-containing protein [Elusimicrobia bacterium]|nr:TetR family transcriptional regulator C-terminal domain-containing protein [Elusimicrobiota bacterium]
MGRKPNPEVPERILQQAEHLIHLRGYNATTLDEIARCCKMTKANLFHHYTCKEQLALAVLDAKIRDYQQRRVSPLCAEGDPAEAVGRMFAEAGRHYTGNGCKAGCFVANIAIEMSDVNELFRKRTSLFFKGWADNMAACLKKCRDKGVFTEGLDPKAAAEAIISLYEGAILLARTHRDPTVFTRVGKLARQLLDSHKTTTRRKTNMGPKTPCGC